MDSTKPPKPLSVRHEAFCQGIAKGMSATKAYQFAGYKVKDEVAATMGGKLLRKIEIQNRIKELREKNATKARMTREELVGILEDEVRESRGKGRANTQAVSALAKMCGWNEPEKIELKTEIEVGPNTLAQLEIRASAVAGSLSIAAARPQTPASAD